MGDERKRCRRVIPPSCVIRRFIRRIHLTDTSFPRLDAAPTVRWTRRSSLPRACDPGSTDDDGRSWIHQSAPLDDKREGQRVTKRGTGRGRAGEATGEAFPYCVVRRLDRRTQPSSPPHPSSPRHSPVYPANPGDGFAAPTLGAVFPACWTSRSSRRVTKRRERIRRSRLPRAYDPRSADDEEGGNRSR